MAIPGYGTAIAYITGWIDRLVPSKKAALVDELNSLTEKYQNALYKGDDTNAAIYRKQMSELRKRAGFTDGDM